MGNPLKSMSYKFFGHGVATIPKILKTGGGGELVSRCLKDASERAQKMQLMQKRGAKIRKSKKEFGNSIIIYIFIYLYLYLYLFTNSCISLRAVTLHIISVCISLHSIFLSIFRCNEM